MAAAARAANNSMVAVEVRIEGKLAVLVGENVEDKQETDFDCCWVTVANMSRFEPRFEQKNYFAGSVARRLETFVNMLHWDSPAVKIFDMAIDAAVALLVNTAVVDRKVRTTNRPATRDGSGVMA